MSDFLKTWCFAGTVEYSSDGYNTAGTMSGANGGACYITADT